MKRSLTSPNRDTTIVNTLQVYEGGTGSTNVQGAQTNLDILPASTLGQPNGPAKVPANGQISGSMFTGSADAGVSLSGPTTVFVSTTNTYTITNYDITTSYTVSGTGGTVSISGETVTYLANATTGSGKIVINGKTFTITKSDQVPLTPTVSSPVDNATNQGSSVTYTASAFSTEKVGDTHANSDWEVSTSSSFASVAKSSYADATNKTSWTATGLSASTTYYMRVRYRSSSGKVSEWSATKVVSTKASFYPSSEQAKLTASDGAADDRFGYSVSISSDGTTALIGAYFADPSGKTEAGAAYIFTRSGATWTQQAKLTASDGAANDYFGTSVSISSDGTTALVSAPDADPSGKTSTGAAYIFTRSGATWTQQAKLTASDGASNDFFGYSVSISSDGNTALVGAYLSDPSGKGNAGAAYIFTRSGATWTQQAKLTASDGAADDRFGVSVSISSDGTTALIGAYQADPSGITNAGAAYIFTRSGSTWTQQAKLTASDGAANDYFGTSVSISSDGNTALVGAYTADPSGKTDAGVAYIFTRSGTTWTQQAKLTASDAGADDNFGYSVSISSDGNTALVSAHYADTSGKSSAGAAYIFTRSDTTWTQQAKLTASDGANGGRFGTSVSISSDGNTALVGAHYVGAAYIFK